MKTFFCVSQTTWSLSLYYQSLMHSLEFNWKSLEELHLKTNMSLCEPVEDLGFSPWLVDCFFSNQGKQLSVSTTPGVLFIVLNVSPCSLTHNENHLIPVWNALHIYNRASFIIPVWSDTLYSVVPVAKLNSNVSACWTYKVHFDISSSRISTAGGEKLAWFQIYELLPTSRFFSVSQMQNNNKWIMKWNKMAVQSIYQALAKN